MHAVILGSLSAIADATVRLLADDGWSFDLFARSTDELERQVADLRARGSQACGHAVDLVSPDAVEKLASVLASRPPDLVLIAFGVLGYTTTAAHDLGQATRLLEVNFNAPARLSLICANALEGNNKGVLAVIGSVAGDRGRQSNYIYGAGKAGLETLIEGLAHRLARAGRSRAILIKPGLVRTPMTDGMNTSGPLWSSPEAVARKIVTAVTKSGVVTYAPGYWKLVMRVIRAMPYYLLHRTAL
jgi:short-subunit dehydrogenase